MPCIEQRLDAEAVAGSEEPAAVLVPKHEGEFTAQVLDTVDAVVLIEVESDFAVGTRGEAMPALLQFLPNGLVAVELAIHHDVRAVIFAAHGLIARGEIDNAEPR